MFLVQDFKLDLQLLSNCSKKLNLLRVELVACEFNLKLLHNFILLSNNPTTVGVLAHEITKLANMQVAFANLYKTTHSHLNSIVEHRSRTANDLTKLRDYTQDLGFTVEASSQYRAFIWGDHIVAVVSRHRELSDLLRLLAQADDTTKQLVATINSSRNLSPIVFAAYAEQLTNVLRLSNEITNRYLQTSAWHNHQQEFIQNFWQEIYPQAYSLQHTVLYLMNWHAYLIHAEQELRAQNSAGLHFFLTTRTLLTSIKGNYYLQARKKLQDTQGVEQALFTKTLHSIVDAQVEQQSDAHQLQNLVLQQLDDELVAWQKKIYLLEQSLSPATIGQQLTVNTIGLWTESYYYQLSANYFTFINELSESPQFRNIPIVSTKLSAGYLSFFTSLGSTMLAGLDSIFIGIGGISYSLISAFKQYYLNDLTSILQFGATLHISEARMLQILPIMKRIISFGVYISIYSLLAGFNSESIKLLTCAYLTASGFREIAGYILDVIATPRHTNDRVATSGYQLMVKIPLQHIAGILGHKAGCSGYMYGSNFFRARPAPTANEILSDPKLCMLNREQCRTLALQELGLSAEAAPAQIAAGYRELAKTYHPDTTYNTATDRMRIFAINQARTRLKDLVEPVTLTPSLDVDNAERQVYLLR